MTQQPNLIAIETVLKALPPTAIHGWSGLKATKIRVVGIEANADHITLAGDKFHGQIRVDVELTSEIDGREVSYRASIPGEVAGVLINGLPEIGGAQLHADEVYLSA